MNSSKQNAFDNIIQELKINSINSNVENIGKSVLLTQIKRYAVGDNTTLPKYAPHCNAHQMHKSFMKRQGTSINDCEDTIPLGEDVWYNGKNWTDADL